jgi:hypothetical protein
VVGEHAHRDAERRARKNRNGNDAEFFLNRYSDSGPNTTQAMKLTSKYRNADNNVGQ